MGLVNVLGCLAALSVVALVVWEVWDHLNGSWTDLWREIDQQRRDRW